MKTETIKVEGLPEGWRAAEIRVDPDQYNKYVGDDGVLYWEAKIKMEKIQPRRIVLEETGEIRKPEIGEYIQNNGNFCKCHKPERWGYEHEIWREVKETDIPLTKEEPYLKLTKKDMLELIEHIKLCGQLNPKIQEFINDK